MNHLNLTHDVIDVANISDIVSAESCGAISLFVGTTRDSFERKRVLSLEYEAYEPMALKQLELICEELRRQWPDIVNIAICHRLGIVGIREASVVIAISSPHRETSLKAVSVAIDDLKKRVPIWKKEKYKGDDYIWKENKEYLASSSSKLAPFNENMLHIEDPHPLPSQLVQIYASEDEIKRRIKCFVEKKREEIDLCNIMDFTDSKRKKQENQAITTTTQDSSQNDETESMGCARVDSIVVKQDCSKCHLKVRRVDNNIGPQTRPDYFNTLDKLMVPIEDMDNKQTLFDSEEYNMQKYPAILERLENIEKHINIPQSKIKNIYQRLKAIEDRLLYLESISPEYGHFFAEKSQVRNTSGEFETSNDIKPTGLPAYERKLYSVNDIDTIIENYEERNGDRQLD